MTIHRSEKEEINLLISIDDNYIEHAKDLINSIILNNDVYLEVYLIYGNELSKDSIKDLAEFLSKNQYGELHSIYFESKILLPMYIDYISITTYFRLFAPYMIDDKTGKKVSGGCVGFLELEPITHLGKNFFNTGRISIYDDKNVLIAISIINTIHIPNSILVIIFREVVSIINIITFSYIISIIHSSISINSLPDILLIFYAQFISHIVTIVPFLNCLPGVSWSIEFNHSESSRITISIIEHFPSHNSSFASE